MVGKISLKTCTPKKLRIMSLCGGKCAYCGVAVAESVDHVIPKSQCAHGVAVPGNYLPACITCNGLKGSMSVGTFRSNLKRNWHAWRAGSHSRIRQRYADFDGIFYFEKMGVEPL